MSVFRILFLALLLLVVVPHSKEEPKEEPREEEEDEEQQISLSPGNCSACAEEARARKEMRLRDIQKHILDSLGLTEAPNVSRAQLPTVPPIEDLLQDYSTHPQDQAHSFAAGPQYANDQDDANFYAAAKNLFAFQHNPPREYTLFLFGISYRKVIGIDCMCKDLGFIVVKLEKQFFFFPILHNSYKAALKFKISFMHGEGIK